jgi:hypothetical protein
MAGEEKQGIGAWINERLHPVVSFESLKPGMVISFDANLRSGTDKIMPLAKMVTTKNGDEWSEFGSDFVVEKTDGTTTEWKPDPHPEEIIRTPVTPKDRDKLASMNAERKPDKRIHIPASVELGSGVKLRVVEVAKVPGMTYMQAICEVVTTNGVVFLPGGDIYQGGEARVEAGKIKTVREVGEDGTTDVPVKEFFKAHPVSIRPNEAGFFRKG